MQTVMFQDEAPTAQAVPEGFQQPVHVVAKPAQADRVLVVDVSHLAHRSANAYEDLRTSDGRRSGHVYGSLRLLVSCMETDLRQEVETTWSLVLCYDGVHAKLARREIYPDYKSGRDPDAFNPVPDVAEAFAALPGLHVLHQVREGDDAIAWVVGELRRKFPTKPLYVLTGDKDLWPLTRDPLTRVWAPYLQKLITADDVEKKFHTRDASRIPLAKALFGDHSDGVKGVKGLRRAQVKALLDHPGAGDVASFYEALAASPVRAKRTRAEVDDVPTPRTVADLLAARPDVEAAYTVVTPWVRGFTTSNVRLQEQTADAWEHLAASLRRYECRSLVKDLPLFFGAAPQQVDKAGPLP